VRAGGIFLRGLAMGAADVVPGVSGGTIAFITGIYPRLLHSLRSFDTELIRRLAGRDAVAAWRHVDGGFLLVLLAGMATGIFSLARLVAWLLRHYPQPLWSFFFGLILASAFLLMRQVPRWRGSPALALSLGAYLAVLVAVAPRGEFMSGELGVFLAGFIAVCAMILPGISGSFILILLGMYGAALTAVEELDLRFLLVFAAGASCGLLSFSRLLYWLLSRYRAAATALLTGFLCGSLVAVWPWKRTLAWVVDRHGELKAAWTLPVLPPEFLARTGDAPLLSACLLAAVLGFGLVRFVDRRWG